MASVRFSDLCHFTDKQWTATAEADSHRYMLFGGARGPGKSFWLRWWLVRYLLRCAAIHGKRGVRTMLACEDYPSLYERQISKVQTEFPPALGKYMAARNEFVLAPQFGSGVIAFRNLDDPSKYQSAEFAAIAVDEITKNPEKSFHILRASMRWPGLEDVRFVAASNPEANWVRSYWIEKNLPDELHGFEDEFAFVPALPDDNPYLPPSYWQMLDTLPGAMRAAWRYGDWYAGVEGLVYENFSAENLTDQEPLAHLPFEVAIDDGYIDPRAVLFIQRQPGGDVLVFDELYQTKTLEEKTIADMLAKRQGIGKGKPELAVISHEAVALRRRVQDAGVPAVNWLANRVAGGKSTRLAAITLTRSLICDGQGHRGIKVHRRCKHLIDEISAGYKYPEGKHGLETEPEDGNDHACQALESWVWARLGKSEGRRARVGEY